MTMNSFERRNKIIQLVNEQGTVLVQDLAGVFAASEATIRADLRFLEQKGVVTRFHGGAAKIMSGNSETETQEVGFKERLMAPGLTYVLSATGSPFPTPAPAKGWSSSSSCR